MKPTPTKWVTLPVAAEHMLMKGKEFFMLIPCWNEFEIGMKQEYYSYISLS